MAELFQSLLGCNQKLPEEAKLSELIFQSLLGCNPAYALYKLAESFYFQSLLGCNSKKGGIDIVIYEFDNFQSLLGCNFIIIPQLMHNLYLSSNPFWDATSLEREWVRVLISYFQSLLGCNEIKSMYFASSLPSLTFQSLLGCNLFSILLNSLFAKKPSNPFWDATFLAMLMTNSLFKNFQSLLGCNKGSHLFRLINNL